MLSFLGDLRALAGPRRRTLPIGRIRRLEGQVHYTLGLTLGHGVQLGLSGYPGVLILAVRRNIPKVELLGHFAELTNQYPSTWLRQSVFGGGIDGIGNNLIGPGAADQLYCIAPLILKNRHRSRSLDAPLARTLAFGEDGGLAVGIDLNEDNGPLIKLK